MNADVRAMRTWMHSLLDLSGEGRLLDIGCGAGEDIALLADETEGSWEFVGMDVAPDTVETARLTHTDPRVKFVAASADDRLPFEDESFDVAYSVNALECLSDRAAFATDCHRVLNPNGQVLVAHWDWDTQTFDGSDRARVRRIVHAFNDWKQAWMNEVDPWMGRRLAKTFGASGLFDGEIRAYTLTNTSFEPGHYGWHQAQSFAALPKRGLVDDADYQTFLAEQQALAERGEYFFSITLFVYLGKKRLME